MNRNLQTTDAKLLKWCKHVTQEYPNVDIEDLSESFRNGLAFCAILHHFHPDLINYDSLSSDNFMDNIKLANDKLEEIGGTWYVEPEDFLLKKLEKQSIFTHLREMYTVLAQKEPHTGYYDKKRYLPYGQVEEDVVMSEATEKSKSEEESEKLRRRRAHLERFERERQEREKQEQERVKEQEEVERIRIENERLQAIENEKIRIQQEAERARLEEEERLARIRLEEEEKLAAAERLRQLQEQEEKERQRAIEEERIRLEQEEIARKQKEEEAEAKRREEELAAERAKIQKQQEMEKELERQEQARIEKEKQAALVQETPETVEPATVSPPATSHKNTQEESSFFNGLPTIAKVGAVAVPVLLALYYFWGF